MLVPARGFEFSVFTDGPRDGTPVVLLHGFPQHSGQWNKVTGPLHEAGLRTIAIDQRGYSAGARPLDPASYAVAECVADVLSIVDTFGLSEFHVVGHDWGAAIAWGLAANFPNQVRSLVAISVPHPAALSKALREDPDQQQRSTYMGVFANLDRSEPMLLADNAQVLRSLFSGSGMTESEMDAYIKPMQEPGALRAALSWYTALAQGGLGAIAPVTVPTTYIWSDEDIALGKTAAEATRDYVAADYRFVSLSGISHWVPDQAPEVVAAEIVARVGG